MPNKEDFAIAIAVGGVILLLLIIGIGLYVQYNT